MNRRLDLLFRNDAAAPGRVRRSLRALSEQLAPSLFDDLVLLIDELVTNSVLHAGDRGDGNVRVRVDVAPETVRAEVADPGPGFSPPEDPQLRPDGSGRGLVLVQELSDRWGAVRDARFVVWFELDRRPS